MIPCWTIDEGKITVGVYVTEDGRIEMGEPGRRRILMRIPLPAGAEIGNKRMLEIPKSELLIKAGAVAILCIKDHSGIGGTWNLAPFATVVCPGDGRKITGQRCYRCGNHNKHGFLPRPTPIEPHTLGVLLAEGRCAQGVTGYSGGGPEYLIAVRPKQFSIYRKGGVHIIPDRINVIVRNDGTVIVEAAENLFLRRETCNREINKR